MKLKSNQIRMLQKYAKLSYLNSLLVILFFASGCTGAASPSIPGTGPQAWVEFPPHGETMEMGPIPIVVYAASTEGVSGITVSVSGEVMPSVPLQPLTTDGSARLVRVDHTWQPPAEGEYIVEANAGGSTSSITFCVVTCKPIDEVEVGPTTTPTATLPFITLPPDEPTSTPTLAPPPPGDVTVSFYASPPYVDAGNCTTLHWDVVGSETVYLNDVSVYFRGMEERCPCETETHKLQVVKPDGSTQEQWVTIDVYGSCSAPSTDPLPPSDTTGPTINAVYAFWESCDVYGQADISDPSSVSWAEFHYNLNGQGWSWIQMNQSGGLWTSQVGVSVSDGLGTPEGSLVYKVRTLDTYNNESWSGEDTLNYLGCGGTQ